MSRFLSVIVILVTLSESDFVLSQSSNVESFFPLKIGNAWFTEDPISIPDKSVFYEHQVIDTVRFENKLYYEVDIHNSEVDLHNRRFFREDSLGRFYEYRNGAQYVIMDFTMSEGDSLPIEDYYEDFSGYIVCLERKEVETFIGTQDEQISFLMDWDSQVIDEEQSLTLQRGVGIFEYKYVFGPNAFLRAALIDGILYGDSTLVSVHELEQEIPTEFVLNQNFPNPFNPSTTIKYSIPYNAHVTLKIYNTKGQEIETLFDQFQSAGNHSITWQPQNISSGLYICRLQLGKLVVSRKMLLLQ